MSGGEDGVLDFTGFVAVVTGAARGLGRRYALDLAARGARVVVTARRAEAADAVREELRVMGADTVACTADAREGEAPVTAAREAFGRIDAVIVNAGHVRDRSFGRMSDEEWSDVLAVHLDGARATVAAAWPTLLAQRSGRVVLTGSGAGLHGNRGQANYAAAKAGVLGLAATLAAEGAGKGVGVNVVLPMALTDMTAPVFDDVQRARLTPERVSSLVLALAHPSCPLTGRVIETGGGWAGAVRWERAAGVRLEQEVPTPEDWAARWADVVRFDDSADRPTSIADSLAAAVGNDQPEEA